MSTNQPQDYLRQKASLFLESEFAFYAIESGLAVLEQNRMYASRPYHFVWMLLLANGFERLLKVVLCLETLQRTNAFPNKKQLKAFSHDLVQLDQRLQQTCFQASYLATAQGAADYAWLSNDPVMRELLLLLRDFAVADRYMFMDQIGEPKAPAHEWPKQRWEEIEALAVPGATWNLPQEEEHAIKRQRTNVLKAHIEQYTRAIARLFVHGQLGSLGRSMITSADNHFWQLDDAQLGTHQYRIGEREK